METTTLALVAFGLQFTLLVSYITILKCKLRDVEKKIHKKGCRCCGDDPSDPLTT